jgi:hypothetical protein
LRGSCVPFTVGGAQLAHTQSGGEQFAALQLYQDGPMPPGPYAARSRVFARGRQVNICRKLGGCCAKAWRHRSGSGGQAWADTVPDPYTSVDTRVGELKEVHRLINAVSSANTSGHVQSACGRCGLNHRGDMMHSPRAAEHSATRTAALKHQAMFGHPLHSVSACFKRKVDNAAAKSNRRNEAQRTSPRHLFLYPHAMWRCRRKRLTSSSLTDDHMYCDSL